MWPGLSIAEGEDGSEDGFPWQEGHLQLLMGKSTVSFGVILVTPVSLKKGIDILYQMDKLWVIFRQPADFLYTFF